MCDHVATGIAEDIYCSFAPMPARPFFGTNRSFAAQRRYVGVREECVGTQCDMLHSITELLVVKILRDISEVLQTEYDPGFADAVDSTLMSGGSGRINSSIPQMLPNR